MIPENESEPPQFSPSTIFEAGVSTRFSADACSIKPEMALARGVRVRA